MKQVLLLDSTDNIIKLFNDYKSANNYKFKSLIDWNARFHRSILAN